jgi:hypothetical protein
VLLPYAPEGILAQLEELDRWRTQLDYPGEAARAAIIGELTRRAASEGPR